MKTNPNARIPFVFSFYPMRLLLCACIWITSFETVSNAQSRFPSPPLPPAFGNTLMPAGELPGVKKEWWNPFSWFRKPSQEQIATVHFSVVGAAPWSKISKDLETNFSLTPDGALKEVIPVTGAEQHQFLEMLSQTLQLQLPTSYTFENGEYKPKPAEVPQGTPTDPFKDKTLPALINGVKPRQDQLDVDPFAQYRTAQALFQLVKLLNQSVASAKKRTDCEAYLLTLQLSLMPYAQNQPYDAYTDFALFVRDERPHFVSPPGPLYQGTGTYERKDGEANPPANTTAIPEVVPLLVTDNMEATSVSNASRLVRQFSLSLAAAVPQIAGKGQFDKFMDQVDKSLGEDLNSLITTARLTENIFRVRFGANRQGSVPYAMVPQTHRVFLLVLVPRQNLKANDKKEDLQDYCEILAMTRLRNRENGKQVAMRSRAEVARALARSVTPLTASGLLSKDFMKIDVLLRLISIQLSGDFRAFMSEVAVIQAQSLNKDRESPIGTARSLSGQNWQQNGFDPGATQHVAEALWLHISQVWSGSVYSSDVVELDFTKPDPEPKFGYPPASDVPWALLMSPGKSSVVRVSGFKNLSKAKSEELSAMLKITRDGIQNILLPAQSARQMPPDTVSYDFGSLDGVWNDEAKLELVIQGKSSHGLKVLKTSTPSAIGATLATSTKALVPVEAGTASFSFTVSTANPESFAVQVEGATVDSASFSPAESLKESEDGRFQPTATSAKARVTISNLDPNTPVKVSISKTSKHLPEHGDPGPAIELPVRVRHKE